MINKELQEKINRLIAELTELGEKVVALSNGNDGGGVFKSEDGQGYWSISWDGDVYCGVWDNHKMDHKMYAIGNCLPTKQAAEDAVRALKLIQKARESQDGSVPNWEDLTQRKYSLYFDRVEICVTSHLSLNIAPIFGFWGDESVCEQFIDENREDLIWFFTEYRR